MKKDILIIIFICCYTVVYAQKKPPIDSSKVVALADDQTKQYLPNYAPLAPNSAAIQRHGNYAVNLATGLPNINIPLYTVKAGGLELPISLNYHASGHKIDEMASWVGWGWSLNYGASLSRSINRNADDMNVSNGSYLSNASFSKNVCLNINDLGAAEMARVGSWDTEPDLFSYNTPESGGKFMLRTGGQPPFMMPWQATKINKITDAGVNKIKAFEVINPSGNLYYFGIDQNGNEVTEQLSSGNVYEGFPVDGIVSWHLTKVLSPNSDDAIYCYYQDGGSLQQKLSSWSGSINYDLVGVPLSAAMIPQEYILSRTNTQKNIQKIAFPNGEVEFIQSSAGVRLDPGNFMLQTINIYNFENGVKTLRKRINFSYSYFTDRLGNNGRLKLDQLIFLDENLANPQIHTFEYETNNYSWFYDGNNPSDMVNQDYFGYFNNKGNVHTVDVAWIGFGSNQVQVAGGAADRSTVEQYMKQGVLNKIKFPTGGFTTFMYEANQYKNNGGVKIGGGLRVNEIKSYTDGSNMASRKTYTYGSSDGAGIGMTTVELSTPIYKNAGVFYPTGTSYTQNINSNGFSEGSYDGTPIYYESATETQQTANQTGNGRTEFTYSFERDIAISTPDYATRSIHPWRRGLLETEKVFAENGVLVKELSNQYQELKTESIQNTGKFYYFAAANWPSGCPSGLLQGFAGGTNGPPMFKYASATNATGNNKLSQKTETNDGITTITDFIYDSNLELTKTIQNDSRANHFNQKITVFPTHSSYDNDAIALEMRNRNMIAMPVESLEEESLNGVLTTLSHQKTVHNIFTGNNSRNLTNNILPKEIFVAPKNGGLEKRVEFTNYDTNGNSIEYEEDTSPTTLIWAYNNTLLLSKVQNATSSQVNTGLNSAGITNAAMSISSLSAGQINQFQNFRNALQNAQISWFSHRPQIGISTTISPFGLANRIEYDTFSRLRGIKDHSNNITDLYNYSYATTAPSGCTTPSAPSISVSSTTLCNINLSATGCAGVVNWSNGQSGNAISVLTNNSSTITATCSVGTCVSTASNALVLPILPTGWQAIDIGNPNTAGCTEFVTNQLTISGVGYDFNSSDADKTDQFHYVYKNFSGDVSVEAKISSLLAGSGKRAGIMFRSSSATNAQYFSLIQDGNGAVGFLKRGSDGVSREFISYQNANINDAWIKIVKTGNSFVPYFKTSPTGAWSAWFNNGDNQANPTVVSFGTNFLVGFLVYDDSFTGANQATFANIVVNGSDF